jgi:hypothetical protein
MGQLLSVILAPLIAVLTVLAVFKCLPAGIPAGLLLVWFILNLRFLAFLTSERGVYFGLRAVMVTYLDGIIMFLGIGFGFLRWMPMVVRKGIGIGNKRRVGSDPLIYQNWPRAFEAGGWTVRFGSQLGTFCLTACSPPPFCTHVKPVNSVMHFRL